jgi:hypothetical protein
LRDRKVEKKFPREISFPPSNILFFPGTIFFSGIRVGKMKMKPEWKSEVLPNVVHLTFFTFATFQSWQEKSQFMIQIA